MTYRPPHLSAAALGCTRAKRADSVCRCRSRKPCPAQVALVKLALTIGAEARTARGPNACAPVSPRDVAMFAVDVAQHIGAGVAHVTPGAARQAARESGYRVSSRGIYAALDWQFWRSVPYWDDSRGEYQAAADRPAP